MQLDLLDGEMTDQCGQDRRPANRSQSQGSRKGQTMSDISGPSGSGSSESADLQSYLESKLAPLSDTAGLIPCKKIWKQKTTPAQRRYCQLQVSALSTKGIGSGSLLVKSWTTPNARDHKDTAGQTTKREAGKTRIDQVPREAFQLIGVPIPWLTPTTSDTNGVRELDGKRSGGLNTQATAVPGLWATPNTLDHMAPKSEEAMKKQAQGARKGRTFPCNLREQVDVRSQEIYAESASLWPTVTTQDNAQMAGQYSKTNGTTLGGAVRQCNAKTEKSAPSQLNPRFSLWLMGYPIEWAYCAERVTPLSRRSRRKS